CDWSSDVCSSDLGAPDLCGCSDYRPTSDFPEQTRHPPIQSFDRLTQLAHSRSFPCHLVSFQVRLYGEAQLRGAPNPFRRDQRQHRLRVVFLQLTLLPFLNRPGGFPYVVHGVSKLFEYARIDAAGFNLLLDSDELGAGLP